MKKLSTILGVVLLTGTASTSVIACGTPDSQKDTRIDISNKITSPMALGQLSENTTIDFLAKLQTSLTQIPDLNTIKTSDYDVYKAGTKTAIQDSDITAGNSLNIKIDAKETKFKGTKDNITVNYNQKDTRIDISNKITSPMALGQLSENTTIDFLAKLQTSLTQIPDLNTIKTSDYDVYKAGTKTAIQDSDITAGNSLNIKIDAKETKFKGTKDNITVNYNQKDTRIDISNKITSPIALGQLSENTTIDFLAKLQTSLTQIPDLNTIKTSDYDVYKAGTKTAIQDSDITAGNSLNIKIDAKETKFKGTKDNITVNYNQKDTRIDLNKIISNKNLGSIPMEKTEPNKYEILQSIKYKNTSASTLTENDFDFKSVPTDKNATIVGKNNYKDEVSLNYEVSNFKKVNIKGIPENTDLYGIVNDKIGNFYLTDSYDIWKSNDRINFYKINFEVRNSMIVDIKVDNDNNVYALSDNGFVYKSNGADAFTIFSKIKQDTKTHVLSVDDNNNIYVATNFGVYKCLSQENEFKQIKKFNIQEGNILSLTADKDGNIYIGNSNNKIYKCLFNENIFNEMTITTSGNIITDLTTDKDGNIYASTDDGVYKCLYGENLFNQIISSDSRVGTLEVDNDNNVYAGNDDGIVYKYNEKDKTIVTLKINNQIWSLIQYDNKIYITTASIGLYMS